MLPFRCMDHTVWHRPSTHGPLWSHEVGGVVTGQVPEPKPTGAPFSEEQPPSTFKHSLPAEPVVHRYVGVLAPGLAPGERDHRCLGLLSSQAWVSGQSLELPDPRIFFSSEARLGPPSRLYGPVFHRLPELPT